jgi:GAF domain-containing protein
MSDDDRGLSLLQQAVSALSQYFVGDAALGSTLHRVAELSMKALPAVTHVGITMLVNDKPGTAVFTSPEIVEIDEAQYRTGSGPCLDAFRNGVPHIIDSTLDAGRWQEFRDSASRHGVLSTLSLPLIAQAGPVRSTCTPRR